jgi:hypothetical protein
MYRQGKPSDSDNPYGLLSVFLSIFLLASFPYSPATQSVELHVALRSSDEPQPFPFRIVAHFTVGVEVHGRVFFSCICRPIG